MAYLKKDSDSGIIHISTEATIALCGLQPGWTTQHSKPVKVKYGSTCGDCISELDELKKVRAYKE